MGFLIEVNFWKGSKIGTSCRNIGHFCSELNEFRPYSFPNCIVNTQLFMVNGSSILQEFPWLEQKLELRRQNCRLDTRSIQF